MLLVPFMAIKIRVIRSIFMFGIVFSAMVPSKGQAGLIGQQGISLYEKGPQKAQKWPYLNDSRLSSKQCLYLSGKTKETQACPLPWLCVWAGLSLPAVASALWTREPAHPPALLQPLLGHQLSWTETPLGKVLSLRAGLWMSLLLVVLQATLSRLAHHQSSFSLPGPGEAPFLICFRSLTCFILPRGLWQVPCVVQRRSLTLYLWSPVMLMTIFELPCYSNETPGDTLEWGDLPCQNICLGMSCSDRMK